MKQRGTYIFKDISPITSISMFCTMAASPFNKISLTVKVLYSFSSIDSTLALSLDSVELVKMMGLKEVCMLSFPT